MEELKEVEVEYILIGLIKCPYCSNIDTYQVREIDDDKKRYKTSSYCKACGKEFLLTNVMNGLMIS